MVTLKFMRYLTVAVRCGSISEAALELNISASAISAAIDQIEEHFKLKLVTRHRARGVMPTSSGREMVKKFQTLLDDYDGVMSEGVELKEAMTGHLHIGYYSPVAPSFLPQIISDIIPERGSLSLHLEECDNDAAQAGLLSGRFDAILFVADGALPQIGYDVLIHAPAYCLLAATHPLASKSELYLSDIKREPIILLDKPLASEYYRDLLQSVDRDQQAWTLVNSIEMVRSLVGAEFGCAVLNMLPTTDITYAGDRVVARPILDDLQRLSLAVGYDKSKPRALVKEFAKACSAYFAGESAKETIVVSSTKI